MTAAREELARLLFMADNRNAADPAHEWEMLTRHGPRHVQHYYEMADGALAAGYERREAIAQRVDRELRVWVENDDVPGLLPAAILAAISPPEPARLKAEPAPEPSPARAWPDVPEHGDREYRQAQWDHSRTPERYGGGLG